MTIQLFTTKYNLVKWKTYIHPEQGITGEGYTPLEAIKDWTTKFTEYIDLYKKRELSIGKFGELLGISFEEAKKILSAENIPLDMGIDSEAGLLDEIENAN